MNIIAGGWLRRNEVKHKRQRSCQEEGKFQRRRCLNAEKAMDNIGSVGCGGKKRNTSAAGGFKRVNSTALIVGCREEDIQALAV